MRHSFLRLALLGLASASLLAACAEGEDDLVASSSSAVTGTPVTMARPDPDRVIVAFKPGRGSQGRAAVHAHGGTDLLEIRGMGAVAVSLPVQARAALANNPNVEYVEEDSVRTLSGSGTEETTPYGITMVQADAVATGPFARKICIIDSGYSMQHDDLRKTNVTASADSGTGDPFFDDNGHGTHVAGTIAAIGGNGIGVVGVMPTVNLHIVKVFTKAGWAYSSSLANAAQACAANGANIISMSLGGSTKNRTEENKFKALNTAGIFSIAAAGNDGNNRVSYPAGYASVMSVGALDFERNTADFSQFNADVEISAPGVAVESATPWHSTASVTVGGNPVNGHSVEGAANGTASGALVDGGLCGSAGSWTDKVVLCQRGTFTFAEKVLAGQNGGATAVIIYNNTAGDLSATMGDATSTIPAIGVSDTAGTQLVGQVGQTADVSSVVVFPASGYEAWDGTSMATPHVAGVAALVWSHNASWTNTQIRNALTATAVDLGAAGRDVNFGFGLVQAADALASLGGGGGGPVNQAPTASFTSSCTELTCAFTGSGSDPEGSQLTYGWSFGATTASASNTFATSGTFAVTLTVTDALGATGSITQNVTVTSTTQAALTISGVGSVKTTKSGGFQISWTTNLPSNSVVTFTGQAPFTNAAMVTAHTMAFTGQRNATYTYSVSSTDANGTTQTSGPYTHQN